MFKAFFLMSFASLSISAQAGCIGEAQIFGKVIEIKKTLSSCRVYLSNDTKLQTSMVCPLDESKLSAEGIEVGMINGHDCSYSVGDSISGILVDNGSFIHLE